MHPKDYDSTVARIAGNLAAGAWTELTEHDGRGGRPPDPLAIRRLVDVAEAIVNECRKRAAASSAVEAAKVPR